MSRRTGVTMTEAVIQSLKIGIMESPRPVNRKNIDAICKAFDSLPMLDTRSADKILGYGKLGIPK